MKFTFKPFKGDKSSPDGMLYLVHGILGMNR